MTTAISRIAQAARAGATAGPGDAELGRAVAGKSQEGWEFVAGMKIDEVCELCL